MTNSDPVENDATRFTACLLLPLPRYILPRPRDLQFDALVADHPARDQWYRARCRRSLTLQMNDFQLESIMRLRLDMLNNRRRLRIVTTAAILVACAGTQAAGNGARPALESRPNYDSSLTTRREGAFSMACDNFGGSSHEQLWQVRVPGTRQLKEV